MKEQAGNRIAYLDALKAVSIMLVVYCHYPLIADESFVGNIFMTIAWGAVPCFMMVSGALMHSKRTFSWKKYLMRLLKTYLAFAFWKAVYLILYANVNSFTPGKVQTFKFIFMFNNVDGVDTSFMWYMIAYMVCLLVYPLTYHAFRIKDSSVKNLKIFLLAMLGFGGILLPEVCWVVSYIAKKVTFMMPNFNAFQYIMPFTNYPNMIFYFILGSLLFENKEKIQNWFAGKKWVAIVILVVGIAGLMCVKYVDYRTWTWSGSYMKQGYERIFTLVIALGMYFGFNVFNFDKFYGIIGRLIGTNTMGIYYMHWALLTLCSKYIFGRIPTYFFGLNIIKTIITTAVCVLITIVIKKIPVLKNIVS